MALIVFYSKKEMKIEILIVYGATLGRGYFEVRMWVCSNEALIMQFLLLLLQPWCIFNKIDSMDSGPILESFYCMLLIPLTVKHIFSMISSFSV